MTVASFFLSLIVIFAAAKLFGEVAERLGQPSVLGEMVGGIIVGISGLRLIDPRAPLLHLLGELGIVVLLFLIGLETDMQRLFMVGRSASAVALTGVALPFAAGFGVARLLGTPVQVAMFLGAALTATSVGVTARVLSDLGRLSTPESQVILGAAVIDDIIGLILLTIVGAIAEGEPLTMLGIGRVVATAFGFVLVALTAGSFLAPHIVRLVTRLRVTKALFFASFMFALTLAWCAQAVGSALIIGAFAAGLVLARTDRGAEIAEEMHPIVEFFVPIFFVLVGAAVDLRQLNPFDATARRYLVIGLLLTAVGVAGKLAAGFVASKRLRRIVIGVGMIPRGEVGLIFARIGLAAGLLSAGLYSSVALIVIVTTFITPPLLRRLLPPEAPSGDGAIAIIVGPLPSDDGPPENLLDESRSSSDDGALCETTEVIKNSNN